MKRPEMGVVGRGVWAYGTWKIILANQLVKLKYVLFQRMFWRLLQYGVSNYTECWHSGTGDGSSQKGQGFWVDKGWADTLVQG